MSDKECCSCGESKSPEQYYRAKSNRDGLQAHCKACTLEKQRARAAKLKKENPEKWRQQNKKRYQCYKRLVASDPALKERDREGRIVRHRLRKGRLSYLHRLLYNRGGRLRVDGLVLLDSNWIDAQCAKQGGLCYWSGVPLDLSGMCPLRKPSLDRVAPGGPYSPDNVVLACLAVNKLRGDASVETFHAFMSELVDRAGARRNADRE